MLLGLADKSTGVPLISANRCSLRSVHRLKQTSEGHACREAVELSLSEPRAVEFQFHRLNFLPVPKAPHIADGIVEINADAFNRILKPGDRSGQCRVLR